MEAGRGISGNVRETEDGSLYCVHCGQALPGSVANYIDRLPVHVGPPSEAGPHIYPDPHAWVDAEVVFRQVYCPHCWTAVQTEVVPR